MKRAHVIPAALIVCAAALRLYAFARQDVQMFSDVIEFDKVAAQPVTSLGFWAGSRPPAVPFIHKLLGSDPGWIAWAQVLLGICAWSSLALAVFSTTKHAAIRYVSVIAVLILGSSSAITIWDKVILAESFSVSFMVLCLACGVLALERASWLSIDGVVVFGFFWGWSRASEIIPIAIFAAIALAAVSMRKARPRWLLVAIAGAAIVGVSQFGNARGLRWEFPMLNVLMQRVLPEPHRVAFFESAGMPMTPDVMRFSGQWASHDNSAIRKDPAYAPFMTWFRRDAVNTYLRLCMSDWALLFGGPWAERDLILSPPLATYQPKGFRPVVPAAIDDRVWRASVPVLAFGVVVGLSLAAVSVFSRKPTPMLALPAGLLVAVPLSALAIWHADAMEIARHSAGLALQIRLGILLLLLYSLDHLIGGRIEGRTARS